ncbi:MAG TPA: biotin/lipoyl-containing protein, partial [Bacteroidales bacterium]|nr:biotin/lipoyl-containing protein [Bacteroidales bacterium]
RAVRDAGLAFIGPPDEAIRLMGNKIEARNLVKRLGLPLIRGATGTPAELLAVADQIGYPLLVKAAAGGGGKGMRIVASADQTKDMLETASNEAMNYFGDGEVYIEKYLDNPHHIEVQLIGDEHGNIATLFERECSIQRRYQKIIEEAPSPNVSPELRVELMEAARKIAREIGYYNAGTIEFLVTGNSFYFLEMNTRIQVEHPVTEMITGVDLVREQVNIAMGKPLSFTQDELTINGHAIETRVYAEDPASNFRPSPGKIVFYQTPAGAGIRVDGYLESGAEVSSQFDPMISKVISFAPSREEARVQLIRSLQDYAIHGIKTNIPLLISLLKTQPFITGEADTNFCNQYLKEEYLASPEMIIDAELLMAAFVFSTRQTDGSAVPAWNRLGFWRVQTRTELAINGEPVVRNLISPDTSIVVVDGENQKVFSLVSKAGHELILDASGKKIRLLYSSDEYGRLFLQHDGNVYETMVAGRQRRETAKMQQSRASAKGFYPIHAPMFGRINQIKVSPDVQVNKGDTLLTLESMKMETRITAPEKAIVKQIEVSSGQLVQDKQLLIVLLNI